jgi:hypothetical protein
MTSGLHSSMATVIDRECKQRRRPRPRRQPSSLPSTAAADAAQHFRHTDSCARRARRRCFSASSTRSRWRRERPSLRLRSLRARPRRAAFRLRAVACCGRILGLCGPSSGALPGLGGDGSRQRASRLCDWWRRNARCRCHGGARWLRSPIALRRHAARR